MREPDLVSAHAFYHGDLDRLIVGAVPAIVGDLRAQGLADDFFFLRYWDGGTHLRLRVRPTASTAIPAVEKLIGRRFADHFERSPALDSMPQRDYAELARTLAEWESMPAYTERLYPNMSVEFIPYVRERDRYGYGASIAAVERHFTDSSRIALDLLIHGLSADQRTTAAAATILLAWFSVDPDPARLSQTIILPVSDSTMEDRLGRQHDQVVRLAGQMLALSGRAADLPPDGTLVRWAQSMSTLCTALVTEVEKGMFDPPTRGWEGAETAIGSDPRLRVLPVLDICAHLLCNRLGLPITEEAVVRRQALDALKALAEGER
jgi:hypothetical protein